MQIKKKMVHEYFQLKIALEKNLHFSWEILFVFGADGLFHVCLGSIKFHPSSITAYPIYAVDIGHKAGYKICLQKATFVRRSDWTKSGCQPV